MFLNAKYVSKSWLEEILDWVFGEEEEETKEETAYFRVLKF